ncbi:hypothetical protein [Dactylosporangium sp. CA-233914]|uniref:hypothetical protein n=1 Tax=Dactylosporangium sp. CA-233914 TaxID=3239934 RepID=UPI003D91F063
MPDEEPVDALIDDLIREILDEASRSGGARPVGGVLESVMSLTSRLAPGRPSPLLEHILLVEALAGSFADALAPALADALAPRIVQLLEGGEHATIRRSGSRPRKSDAK